MVHILSYLPLSMLLTLLRVSHKWYDLIDGIEMNRETIYQNAAFLEGYIPKRTELFEDLCGGQPVNVRKGLYSSMAMANVTGWKDFCTNCCSSFSPADKCVLHR